MFYTYLWLREDGTPYYVGKGRDDRAFRNCQTRSVRRPRESWRTLIQNHNSEDEAFEAEKFLISFYGRLDLGTGVLRNRTDGGDGPSGAVRSQFVVEEQRKRMLGTAYAKDHKLPTETKKTISDKIKALWADPLYREHMKKVHAGQGKGRRLSEHTKELCRLHHSPLSNRRKRALFQQSPTKICVCKP